MEVSYYEMISNAKNNKFDYSFNGEKVIAKLTYDSDVDQDVTETDEFDFTGMPDGVLVDVETTLSVNPILKAERVDGVLFVTLIKFVEGGNDGGDQVEI